MIEFLWEHRGVVAVLLVLMALGDIGLNVGSAADALWQIHRLLDGERRAREKIESGPYSKLKLGHYRFLVSDGRSRGNLVGGGRWLVFAPFHQSVSGWRAMRWPVLFPIVTSIYLGAYVLDHDQKAGCVEQSRHY